MSIKGIAYGLQGITMAVLASLIFVRVRSINAKVDVLKKSLPNSRSHGEGVAGSAELLSQSSNVSLKENLLLGLRCFLQGDDKKEAISALLSKNEQWVGLIPHIRPLVTDQTANNALGVVNSATAKIANFGPLKVLVVKLINDQLKNCIEESEEESENDDVSKNE